MNNSEPPLVWDLCQSSRRRFWYLAKRTWSQSWAKAVEFEIRFLTGLHRRPPRLVSENSIGSEDFYNGAANLLSFVFCEAAPFLTNKMVRVLAVLVYTKFF